MHTRHLVELVGQEEPESGLTVCGYSKPFDFEYQVRKHVEMMGEDHEERIRLALAVGQAWLHYDDRVDGVADRAGADDRADAADQGWTQAGLFDGSDAEVASEEVA